MGREELEGYLYTLEAALEVEIDIHGTSTQMAKNIWGLIVLTRLELDKQIQIC